MKSQRVECPVSRGLNRGNKKDLSQRKGIAGWDKARPIKPEHRPEGATNGINLEHQKERFGEVGKKETPAGGPATEKIFRFHMTSATASHIENIKVARRHSAGRRVC